MSTLMLDISPPLAPIVIKDNVNSLVSMDHLKDRYATNNYDYSCIISIWKLIDFRDAWNSHLCVQYTDAVFHCSQAAHIIIMSVLVFIHAQAAYVLAEWTWATAVQYKWVLFNTGFYTPSFSLMFLWAVKNGLALQELSQKSSTGKRWS